MILMDLKGIVKHKTIFKPLMYNVYNVYKLDLNWSKSLNEFILTLTELHKFA
jgi:hypothetical protein